jgi:hypothetical protein
LVIRYWLFWDWMKYGFYGLDTDRSYFIKGNNLTN